MTHKYVGPAKKHLGILEQHKLEVYYCGTVLSTIEDIHRDYSKMLEGRDQTISQLLEALKEMVSEYVDVCSADYGGYWRPFDPEQDECVIKARAAIEAAEGTTKQSL